MVEGFAAALRAEGKSEKTVESYCRSVREYCQWYRESFGNEMEKLLAANVSDYVAYLRTVKDLHGTSLNPKMAALKSFNRYLIESQIQEDLVVTNRHRDRVQSRVVSPSVVEQKDVDAFRQAVLLNRGVRDHAIVTVMAYSGLRVSETINLKLADVDLVGREMLVCGKGNKERLVHLGHKVTNAIKEYLKERDSDSPYLFVSRQSEKLERSSVNRICNDFSEVITPHVLRHFFCAHALAMGYRLNEVANQAGHTNVNTTMGYMNPSRQEMKDKADLL